MTFFNDRDGHFGGYGYDPFITLFGRGFGLAQFLAILYGVMLVLLCIAAAIFTPMAVIAFLGIGLTADIGMLWQPLTYSFANIPMGFWDIISLALGFFIIFSWMGPDIEQYVGRRNYFLLYLSAILIPGLVLIALRLLGIPGMYFGWHGFVTFNFVAFAILYPNVRFFIFPITLATTVIIFLGLMTLVFLVTRQLYPGVVMWTSAGVAYFGLSIIGVRASANWIGDWLEQRRQAAEERRLEKQERAERESVANVDAILDKISREGMGSLTPAERKALERASQK